MKTERQKQLERIYQRAMNLRDRSRVTPPESAEAEYAKAYLTAYHGNMPVEEFRAHTNEYLDVLNGL